MPQESPLNDPTVVSVTPQAAALAAQHDALVSVGDWIFIPERAALELTANRSPIADLLHGEEPMMDVDIDYEMPDGTEGTATIAVYAVRLHLRQAPDGRWSAVFPASAETTGIPHGIKVLRIESGS